MHTYERLWSDDPLDDPPSIATFRFQRAEDVVAYAQQWCCIGRNTWPDVWHIDDAGAVVSYLRGSTLDSIQEWSTNPELLLPPRASRVADHERWVVVDSRQAWKYGNTIVDEGDAAAFLSLRAQLVRHSVDLLDVVVFDDQFHWWSLHELTSGRTQWEPSECGLI